jgi:hypothetical protein
MVERVRMLLGLKRIFNQVREGIVGQHGAGVEQRDRSRQKERFSDRDKRRRKRDDYSPPRCPHATTHQTKIAHRLQAPND